MVAAAATLCLESTSTATTTKLVVSHHRRSVGAGAGGRQQQVSAAYISTEDCTEKMALNFTAAAKKASPSAVAQRQLNVGTATNNNSVMMMDTLMVSNGNSSQQRVPQISPNAIVIRRINEVLAQSSPSPSTPASASEVSGCGAAAGMDENSRMSSEDGGAGGSVQTAETLKSQLMQAIDKNDFTEVDRIIDEIESAQLSKAALEKSRIGAVVNTLRKNIVASHAEIARKCRALIKSWRSNVEALTCSSSRPGSSCGSSAGTPALVSPSIRRVVGKTVTPTSQIGGGKVATPTLQVGGKVVTPTPPQIGKVATPTPPQIGKTATPNYEAPPSKRAKISPAVVPPSPTVSVIEARRNVQSTEQLIFALGMEKFLNSGTLGAETKVEETSSQTNNLAKSEPLKVETQQQPVVEKRGRKRRAQASPVVADAANPAPVPRIKIRFGGKSAEEHDAEEAKPAAQNGTAATVVEESMDTSAPSEPASKKHVKKPKTSKKKTTTSATTTFSWYAKLPSVEELEKRCENPTPVAVDYEPDSPTQPTTWKFRERQIVLMPYLDSCEPDPLHYDFPDKERFMVPKRVF